MKKYLMFLLTAGITLYFIIMYESPEAYRLLAVETMWFLLALIQLGITEKNVQVELLNYVKVVNKGTNIPIQLNIKNKGILPVPFINIYVETDGKKDRQCCYCSLKGHEAKDEMLYVEAENAGFCRIRICRIMYYDLLHLFGSRKKGRQSVSILVLPQIYPVAMEIRSSFRYHGEESGLYYEEEEGSDPSEILEIREYCPGDRMQKIHWKLSQRTDKLMVKEYSEPIGFAVVFLLDSRKFHETYLETFMSISMEMCNEKCIHYICYADTRGVPVRKRVIKEENLYLILQFLMDTGTQTGRVDKDMYDDWYGAGSYHTCIRLTEELELYKQDELVGKIDKNNIEQSLAGLMLEL
ncbi:MAG: DUF58 domain-containing protein [Lachnospiraceae bacterium]|nr:DUF58 domain-containing protein [Lachnospiraceae bacterium]